MVGGFGRVVRGVCAAALGVAAAPAFAVGTSAGSTITNIASATYKDGSGTQVTVPSNKVDLRVDEVLDVKVVTAEPGPIATKPGLAGQVARFTVTNTGNGAEAYSLAAVTAIGGDDFDPTATAIYIDANGNGQYDPGVDTQYVAGQDPVIAADASITVFVLSTIPGTTVDGNKGQVDLVATAVKGSGKAGTVFIGKGIGGGDAVVGSTTAIGRDKNLYAVSSASVALVKSATVSDPWGGTSSAPKATITYKLVATVSGSGSMTDLTIGDSVPTGTTFVPGSITLEGAALTDAADTDAGETAAGRVTVRLGVVPAGQSRTVAFKVTIN